MQTKKQNGSAASLAVVILALVVAAAAIGWAMYVVQVKNPTEKSLETQNDLLIQMTGLATSVSNKLDEKFTDTDTDGIADAPKDTAGQLDPPKLMFSYVSLMEDSEQFKEPFKDFLAHVSKVTGKPVEYAVYQSTDDQLRAMKNGELHVAGFGTGAVPIAVDACGFVPLYALADDQGKGLIHMEIIVPADSGIRSLSDLRGHELTLTEPASNSGFKAPLVLIKKEANLFPGKDYEVRYSNAYDASIEGIASHRYQAAAVASDVLARDVAAGKIKTDQFRSIYQSGTFPSAGFGYAYNLKPELAAKIKQAYLDFPWKGSSMDTHFGPAGQHGFIAVNFKEDWKLVRNIDDAIGYAHTVRPVPVGVPSTQPTMLPTTAPTTAAAPDLSR